jgi:DNA-binding response OmpR family regulator
MQTAVIVEDNPDQAHLAAQLVRLRDYEPYIAPTGEDGLALARRVQPDLILLDLMLPDIGGFDVCLHLRREPQTRTTPIVMVTALGDDKNRQRGFRVGANAYVTKPYGAEDLFEAIESARQWRIRLQRSRLQGEIHVELNSEPRLLQDVNEFLSGLIRETPLGADQIAQLRQAIMEMGTNAIEWGNRHRVEELVQITYRVFADRVEIVVKDQGSGYDPHALPHAAQPDDPLAHMDVREKLGLREGGFGLLISRGMVDELRHNAIGNEVTLIKRFAQPDAPPSFDDAIPTPPEATPE